MRRGGVATRRAVLLATAGVAALCSCGACEVETRVSALGMGLFAGRNWTVGEVEVAIGVPVPLGAIFGTELVNYVEGLNETHCLLALGSTLLINHVPQAEGKRENVRKMMSLFHAPLYRFKDPYGWSIDIVYDMRSTVFKGEEFLTNYGGDDWLEDRGIPVQQPTDLAWTALPGCPLELTTWADQRLVAAKSIARGTVIEVSRAILLPVTASLLGSGPLADLLWWPPGPQVSVDLSAFDDSYAVHPRDPLVHYALLLTGRGLLYGITSGASNVDYAWVGEMSLSEEGGAGSLLRMVAFSARRDIAAGEPLVVDLQSGAEGRRTPDDGFSRTHLHP